MRRREAAGISDSVERMQPQEAPAFDQALVGKRLEVLWKYHDKDTGEPILIWSTGRVARVADGLTDKKSARGKKLLPAGMVLWEWDADPEFAGEVAGQAWLHLLPKKWTPSSRSTAGGMTLASSARRRRRYPSFSTLFRSLALLSPLRSGDPCSSALRRKKIKAC